MATVDLNIGPVDILHVFKGKCYPLVSQTNNTQKEANSLEYMEKAIEHWHARNAENPSSTDLMLLDTNPNAKAKLSKKQQTRKV